MTTDVDILVSPGRIRCIPIPVTAVDVEAIAGPCILFGWSLREAHGVIPSNVSNEVTSPGAGATIATLTGLKSGTYQVEWSVSLEGTLAAGDANNFALTSSAGDNIPSLNTAVAGVTPQPTAEITVGPSGSITVKSIAAGTVGAIYGASISIAPLVVDDALVEFQDGNNPLGESGMGLGGSDTQFFGPPGVEVRNNVNVHVIAGTVTGVVYAYYQD